jgi:hypothetical protein
MSCNIKLEEELNQNYKKAGLNELNNASLDTNGESDYNE